MKALGDEVPVSVKRMAGLLSDIARERWHTLVVQGGYAALEERLGATRGEVRDALMRGASIRLKWNRATVNGLWSFHHSPATRSRPAKLLLTLSPVLRPDAESFAERAREAPEGSEAMKPLPFSIYRLPDGGLVLHDSRGGIREATTPEVLMWKALGRPITRPPK